MGIFNWFKAKPTTTTSSSDEGAGTLEIGQRMSDDIFKAYIPEFLYKPPFGFPRKVNLPYLKLISKNAYVFSIIKTLCDEAASVGWKVQVKEEYQDEGVDYSDKLKEVTKFFQNPNGNEQSFKDILRQLITGICEVDAGVLVKVFNPMGELKQIFCRDGATFLKNPDIYGYMGNRKDFVPPTPAAFTDPENPQAEGQIHQYYETVLQSQAAYFQYGWTHGSMPVPFGRREIVYMIQNPRPDSIYGRSPVEILADVILTLIYGSTFNLDFYTNNNMPEGVIQLLGAQPEQLKQFRKNWESQFKLKDEFGKRRKKFFQFPISSSEVKFTPFQLLAKDMEIIAQQQWFTKVLWMAFGVTAEEMGFTENSNRAVSQEQTKLAKRKALSPLLGVISYYLSTQVVPEFFESKDFSDCPLEFVFDDYDIDLDIKALDLAQKELDLGIKTSEMIAKERGIDIEELKKSKAEAIQVAQEQMMDENGQPEEEFDINNFKKSSEEEQQDTKEPKEEEDKKPEEKAEKSPLKEMEEYIDNVADTIVSEIDKL